MYTGGGLPRSTRCGGSSTGITSGGDGGSPVPSSLPKSVISHALVRLRLPGTRQNRRVLAWVKGRARRSEASSSSDEQRVIS